MKGRRTVRYFNFISRLVLYRNFLRFCERQGIQSELLKITVLNDTLVVDLEKIFETRYFLHEESTFVVKSVYFACCIFMNLPKCFNGMTLCVIRYDPRVHKN